MNAPNSTLIEKAERIVMEVLNIREHQAIGEVAQDSHPKWDSLRHAHLVVRLQNELGIRFSGSEIAQMKTTKKVLEIVSAKLCIP